MGRVIDDAVALVVEGAGRLRRRWAGDRGIERLRGRRGATSCQGERRCGEREMSHHGLGQWWADGPEPGKAGVPRPGMQVALRARAVL